MTVTRYQKRISGPLMDRIDIHMQVPRVEYQKLRAVRQLQLTARAYHRVVKLSRTIADLAGSEDITQVHLAEALQYRPKIDFI
jgi:magnesium chelatase family protein